MLVGSGVTREGARGPAGDGRPFGSGAGFPEVLGPMPEATLACFVDLGLTDHEIAVYFGLALDRVVAMTRAIRARMEADPCAPPPTQPEGRYPG